MKKFIKTPTGLTILVIVTSIGLISLLSLLLTRAQSPTSSQKTITIEADDHIKTASDSARLTLVEYSDFQCPACAAYSPLINQLSSDPELSPFVTIVFRHMPLSSIHPHAELAAAAAEAAAAQGKFWDMHDLLFEHQTDWAEADDPQLLFTQYATNLGLDPNQFQTDLTSKAAQNKVSSDYLSGRALGVNSTPSFFLNGTRIEFPPDYQSLKSLLTQALPE